MWTASLAWRQYRRAGGKRARTLPDLLVGAHARCHAARLVSRDRGAYQRRFQALEVIDPAA